MLRMLSNYVNTRGISSNVVGVILGTGKIESKTDSDHGSTRDQPADERSKRIFPLCTGFNASIMHFVWKEKCEVGHYKVVSREERNISEQGIYACHPR
jgi:hypothetical protein